MAPDGSSLEIELGRDEGGSGGGPFGDQGTSHSLEPSRTSHGNCVQGCHTAAVPPCDGRRAQDQRLPCLQAEVDQTLPEHPQAKGCVSLPRESPGVLQRYLECDLFGKLEAWDKHSFSLKQQLGGFCCYFCFLLFPPKFILHRNWCCSSEGKRQSWEIFLLRSFFKGQITLEIAERVFFHLEELAVSPGT